VLGLLAEKVGEYDCRNILSHPNVSIETVLYIIGRYFWFPVSACELREREEFLKNPLNNSQLGTPECIESLSQSDTPEIRIGVATLPAVGEKTLLRLSDDSDSRVRQAILLRPSLSINVLRALYRHDDCYREPAQRSELCESEYLINGLLEKGWGGYLANNFNLSSKYLDAIADVGLPEATRVSLNPNTSAGTLEKILGRWQFQHAYQIAVHRNATPQILNRIARSGLYNLTVLLAITGNPNTSIETLEMLTHSTNNVKYAVWAALESRGVVIPHE
jgi:hypothetical protein